ncbi:MAG: DUF4446 family protein [Selenomonadaceae bacterium]|nr:DUF4446 family protein [Selenomonadaceae bacterium]
MAFKDAITSIDPIYFMIGFGVLLIITYALMINLWLDLSYMKKRYKKMMNGVDGGNLERLINGQADEVGLVVNNQREMKDEIEKINSVLTKAITRIAVVRFDAFDNMSNDLSYCIAMLDAENNGIIISGIFGREEARTYAKPIVDGNSDYKLTREEEQALKEAMKK